MCFTSHDITKYIAKEDIVCYKKVSFINCRLGACMSYWTEFKYEFGKLYNLQNSKAVCAGYLVNYNSTNTDLDVLKPIVVHDYIKIDIGFHSYKYATNEENVKCIIPAGSEYYINYSEYCSNQIIIKEKI